MIANLWTDCTMRSIKVWFFALLVAALSVAAFVAEAHRTQQSQGNSVSRTSSTGLEGKRAREARENVRRWRKSADGRKPTGDGKDGETARVPKNRKSSKKSKPVQEGEPSASARGMTASGFMQKKRTSKSFKQKNPRELLEDFAELDPNFEKNIIKDPRDKLARAIPRAKGSARRSVHGDGDDTKSTEAPPQANPWYHGDDSLGYKPYGHTTVTNWNVPSLAGTGVVAYFRFYQMMVRVDDEFIAYINTTTGEVLLNPPLECLTLEYVVRANATVGYYGCADGTIVLFDVMQQKTLSTFKLPANNKGFDHTDYPYLYSDEEAVFQYIPHLQQNLLLLQIQNKDANLEAAQVVMLNDAGAVVGFGPILGGACAKVSFVGLTRQAETEALSAVMVCSSGEYFLFSDPSVSDSVGFSWSTGSTLFRTTPNIRPISYPPGYNGPMLYYIKSMAFSYLNEANPADRLAASEVYTDTSNTVNTRKDIPRQTGTCGNLNRNAMQGPAIVLGNVFLFTTVCGFFGYNLNDKSVLYSFAPGQDMEFKNLFWGGAGEGATTVGLLSRSVVDESNVITVLDITSGGTIYRNVYKDEISGVIHSSTSVLYKPPGFAKALDAQQVSSIVVLTAEKMTVVDVNTGLEITTATLRVPSLMPPVWMPVSNSIVVVGTDYSLISYSTLFGVAYLADTVPTIHNGVVYASATAEDYNIYIYAVDQAGRVMWRSERAFGKNVVTFGVFNRYVMAVETPMVTFIDMYSGATVDFLEINSNCEPIDPRLATTVKDVIHSKDGANVYFTAGTKCLYHIGDDLTLSGFTLPFRTANPPVIDNINNYVFAFEGYNVVALDMDNYGEVLWTRDLDNAPLGLVPLSESVNTDIFPNYKPDFVYVLCEFGIYALHYPRKGKTMWSYLVRNGTTTHKVVTNLLIFNQAAYIKYGNTVAKITLDPTAAYENRIMWTAFADNEEKVETVKSERLLSTPTGMIIWVGGNDIKVYDSQNGQIYLDKTDSCLSGAYGSILSYDAYMNALAVSCGEAIFLYNMTTGIELFTLLKLETAAAVSLRDGVLIAANSRRVFIHAMPPNLLPPMDYFKPLPTIAPAGTFAPLPTNAKPIPAPTLPTPVFNGVYNAPPPFVANMTTNTFVTELKWNKIFTVSNGATGIIRSQDGFTFAEDWSISIEADCGVTRIHPVGVTLLDGVLLVTCEQRPNAPHPADVFFAFNAQTGERMWFINEMAPSDYYNIEGESTVVVSYNTHMLAAFSVSTGERLWERDMEFEPTSVVIMQLTSATDKDTVTDYLIYTDIGSTINAIAMADGSVLSTIDEACTKMSPVLASGQQDTAKVQRGLSHYYYMCNFDLKRWEISTTVAEVITTFEAPNEAIGLYFSTNVKGETPVLMVVMNHYFDIYTVEGTMVKIFSYACPEGSKFFGNSAYLAEKKLAIATFGNAVDFNVNFVAIDVAHNRVAWENYAGAYNYLVVSNTMASATMLPDSSGNFVYINDAVFVLSSVNGNVNTQFQGNYVSVSFPNVVNQSFIEGPDLVTQTQTRLVVGSETIAALIIVDPMIDNSPDAYGWSFSGTDAAKGFESYTDCISNEHFTIVFDEDGIVAQIDDAGYVKWVSNGLDDESAPINIIAVAYVSGKAVENSIHPNGYIALITDHGVTFVSAKDGRFVVELNNILDASLAIFPDHINYLAWGDSVYVATYDFVFRFDPFSHTMTFFRVATYPLQYITAIGAISLDGTIIVVNTNFGAIIGVNTTSMSSAFTAAFTGIGSPVTGFAPVCANRTAALRGTVDPTTEYFIAYSAPTATFTYLRFSDLMILQMINEAPSATFASTDDCHLLIWSQWVMAKVDNTLKNGEAPAPIWSKQVAFVGEAEEDKVQFAPMSNIGVLTICGAHGEYFTFNYIDGEQLSHFIIDGVTEYYETYFSVAGQGVRTPMVADAIFVDTDYGGAYVRATTGEIISKMLDTNLHIILPTTPTVTYQYLEFGTLLTINPIPLAAAAVNPALGLKPIATKSIFVPADYSYDFDPVITEPFSPEYTDASFAMRIWAEPGFNQSTEGYRYVGSFVTPNRGGTETPSVVALVTIHGHAFVQFRDALSGQSLADDVPIEYDATQQARWIGRLSGAVGGYCTSGNKLIGFSLTDFNKAGVKLFSTQLAASVLVNPPYPHSDVPNVPIMNLVGDKVTCMLLTDAKAACVNSDAGSPQLGAVIVNFNCPLGSDHFGPPFVDSVRKTVVFSCMAKTNDDKQTLTMTAFDVLNPAAAKWTYVDDSNTVAGVDGTINYMVVFVSTAESSSGAYMVSFETGTKVNEFLVPSVILVTAVDGWEQDIVYAIFAGYDAADWNIMLLIGIDLTNGKLLWKQSPPPEVPVDADWQTTAIISSLDKTHNNWVSVFVFSTGVVCAFDVDTGANDWCVTTELATTAQFVEMYGDGFLLWGQPNTNLVEFRNLADPRQTWFLSTNNGFSELAHSLYTFNHNGLTFIHRAFSFRMASYVVGTERSAIFPNYYVADSLSQRFIVLQNYDDATMAVYDTVDDALLWGVHFFSRSSIEMTINPALYAPNDVPKTVLVAYTNDAIMGLSAVDGSLEFAVSLPFCNSGLSPIQSAHWDEVNGYLYVGYDTCIVAISAADGSYHSTDLGSFIGRSIAVTDNCLIVVSLFGDVTCYARPVKGVIDTTPLWIDAVGLYTTDFDINQYGSFLVFTWTDNQVMLSEKTGERVFERNTRDVDVRVEIWANYLVMASDDGIKILDLSLDTPANKRELLNWPAEMLVPVPHSDEYLSPSRPVITPWGLAVAEVRQRIFGIDLKTMRLVFNQTSYSTLESLKQQPCNYMYVEPKHKTEDAWQEGIQRQVLVCDGNTYSAVTGATFTQAPPLTFTFANKGALFPNGQTVAEYAISGYSEGTYTSELPFSYLKHVATASLPTAFPTSADPTGTLRPDHTRQTQYAPYPTLPEGITLPDQGCVFAIENQRTRYDACIEEIILLEQRAGTFDSAKCGDVAKRVTHCADEWIRGVPPNCHASTQYLQIAAKSARASPAFPWCAKPTSCKDGKAADVCAAFDVTEAHNKAGTPYPDVTIPAPAGIPPIYSSIAPPKMPSAVYKYFSFHAVAPQGAEKSTAEELAARVQTVLGLKDLPRLKIANISRSSSFDFDFADQTVAFAQSSLLAKKIADTYGQTASELGLVAVSFTPYGPVDPPTPPPTTTTPATTATATTYAPYTTPASLIFYRFRCVNDNFPVPENLPGAIGDLLNLNYDPDVRIFNENFNSFEFEFTNYYAAGTLSPKLNGLILDDHERVETALGVDSIEGHAYEPEPPTTLPPSPQDADDERPPLSGPAVAALIILVVVAVVVGALLVYVFVIKKSTNSRRDDDMSNIVEPMTEAV